MNNDELLSLQIDYINELFNIGVGLATQELSSMLCNTIKLTAPDSDVLMPSEVAERISIDQEENVMWIRQGLRADFCGELNMLFREEDSKNLSAATPVAPESTHPSTFNSIDKDVILDLSSVILAGVFQALNLKLHAGVQVEPAEMHTGLFRDLFRDWCHPLDEHDRGLYLSIGFNLVEKKISNQYVFFFNMTGLDCLLKHVRVALQRDGLL